MIESKQFFRNKEENNSNKKEFRNNMKKIVRWLNIYNRKLKMNRI